jgi:L-arabinokinase
MADVVSVLTGEPHALTQVRGEPCQRVGSVRLSDDLSLVGIDCGFNHPQAEAKYEGVRTAAFMGRALIDRILQHEGLHDLQWDGRLSRISVTDYVERFRDRIPTKISGREFLDRFGETGDWLTRIDPAVIYKVRSRTEHQIYEHDRVHQLAECLSRGIRNRDARALEVGGELMYASHWSYGQRCGLGSVETDLLVGLLRQKGVAADIYGAKITGRGCGGVVAVLMRASEQAAEAVDRAMADYRARTGREATLIRGSLPGLMVAGVQVS